MVRTVTGDNILTAKSIAEEAGILGDSNDVVMEGSKFRTLNRPEQDKVIPVSRCSRDLAQRINAP